MRIRWKILITLLVISLVPVLILRLNGQWAMGRMGDELAGKTRNTLIRKAQSELQTLVEEHARILQRERQLIEMALSVQATKLEQSLAQSALSEIFEISATEGETDNPATPAGTEQAGRRYQRVMGSGHVMPLSVSFDHLSYGRAGGHRKGWSITSPLVPIYRSLASAHPDLFLWQITTYENGVQTIYPAVNRGPHRFMSHSSDWYPAAREQKGFTWTLPRIDPLTGQMGFYVAQAITYPDGSTAGVTAIMVPVESILSDDEHFKKLSDRVIPLLVRTVGKTAQSGSHRTGIRILARRQEAKSMHHHWQAMAGEEWFTPDDGIGLPPLVEDLSEMRTGVATVSYKQAPSLLGYAPLDRKGTALLVIVPQADLVAEADIMEAYVQDRIERHILITGIGVFLAVLAVAWLAVLFSKAATRDLSLLVDAFRRVADGDFKTRVGLKAHDEIGELGRTFDRMIPALEERVKIKQALDLTTEIQQNLLPRKMPASDYLDISARSVYCDETGGDFFDFPGLCCREPDVVGLAVGDVSGHGIPAALLMATTRAALQSRVSQPGSMEEIMGDLNVLVTKDTAATNHFVTTFYAEFDPPNKMLAWVRAGHDPALIYCPRAQTFTELQGRGPALGLTPDFVFQASETRFEKGQIFLVGTDGIWETRNPDGEMFGKKRIQAIIRENSKADARALQEMILTALDSFRQSVKLEDDVTIVVIKAR